MCRPKECIEFPGAGVTGGERRAQSALWKSRTEPQPAGRWEVTNAAIAAGKPGGSLPESQSPGPHRGKAGRVGPFPVCLIYTFGPLEQLILETRFTQETQQVEMVGKQNPFSEFWSSPVRDENKLSAFAQRFSDSSHLQKSSHKDFPHYVFKN